ncbi:MAG: ribokinase [Lachnospiraceae bacterium]|nr:ribokinase [Lachnospiraceae bacterium]
MKILNFGSLNIDYVYRVAHILQPGETLKAGEMEVFPGGKGLNQSIAAARAGAEVYHAGMVGADDGGFLLDVCRENHVNTDYIRRAEGKSGHTIIQVDDNAQNSILLFGGGNRKITEDFIGEVLAGFGKGDILVLQNEINLLDVVIDRAYEKGMKIVLNPSPFDEGLDGCDLSKVSVFLVNEIEAGLLAGENGEDGAKLVDKILKKYPEAQAVVTMGAQGAFYGQGSFRHFQSSFPVKAVDTTAAGDTFTGYFVYGMMKGEAIEVIMERAAMAAAVAVSRKGAVPSIPKREEIKMAGE